MALFEPEPYETGEDFDGTEEQIASDLVEMYETRNFRTEEYSLMVDGHDLTVRVEPYEAGDLSYKFENILTLGDGYKTRMKATVMEDGERLREFVPTVVGLPRHDIIFGFRAHILGALDKYRY